MSSKTWIQTRSGRKVDLLDPHPDVIEIDDIAHALSNLCRYTGHTERFYTVAEHSWRVSVRAEELVIQDQKYWRLDDGPRGGRLFSVKDATRVARWGLLHDATEAYLGDVSRPLKHLPGMEGYRQLEKEWTVVIAKRFGLVGDQPSEVSQADMELLGTEAYHLMQPIHPEWGGTCPEGKLPDPLPIGGLGWDRSLSLDHFLMRFDLLFPGRR